MSAPRPVRAHAGSPEFLAIVAAAVPPLPVHDHARPMCAAWDDHRQRSMAIGAKRAGFCCVRAFETLWTRHNPGCSTGVPRDERS